MDTAGSKRREWKRVAFAVLLVVAVVGIVSSDTLHGALLDLLSRTDRLVNAHPRWGALVFMGLAALSAVLAFFSSVVIVPVGVSAWGKTICILLLWMGWVIGGICTYLVGRMAGRPIVSALSSHEAVARYEDRISRHTPFWIVFLFQSAMPSELPGYVLGIARYSFWRYLAVVAVLEFVWAVGTVYLSEGLLERRLVLIVVLSLVGVGLVAGALYLLHGRLYSTPASGG